MRILAVIPARFSSSRLPGKPLELIGAKPMIQHVYEQVKKAKKIFDVVVATDDERIVQAITGIGGKAQLTNSNHLSGTDRVIEIMKHFPDADGIINIQGDEPFIEPEEIELVAKILIEKGSSYPLAATLVKKLVDPKKLENPSIIKVVVSSEGKAIYFSRSPIPFIRDHSNRNDWPLKHPFWQHIGIYGYNIKALQQISQMPPSLLEKAESLEQLRWIENEIPIFTAETKGANFSVDTPEDLEQARIHYKKSNNER